MSQKKSLSQLLSSLNPIASDEISFEQFLKEVSSNPAGASCAPAVIMDAIEKMGVEKPEDEKDSERRNFLKMLEDRGYHSFLAFKHVAGSQRFVQDNLLSFWHSAATGGAELGQFLILDGPSGSGKDYLADGVSNALEMNARVFVVKGCPDSENPLNLLKLFERKHKDVLKAIAEGTGLGDKLTNSLKVALNPCKHCRELVMGSKKEPNATPNFDKVKIVPLDISAATIGVSKWEPGDNHSLISAMRQGNRGFLNMPDAFIHRELEPGKTDERLVLLSAPQYRRLPGIAEDTHGVAPPSPLDTFIMATTNRIAFEKFLKTLPDPEAFTNRAVVRKKPYNLVRVEEIRAYKEIWENFQERPVLDPLVMKIVATVAILSRFAPPPEGQPFAHPLDAMRIHQGEQLKVKPRSGTEWGKVWSTTSSSSSSYDRGYGSYGSGSSSNSTSSTGGLKSDATLSPEILWKLASKDEGMIGLDMRLMPRVLGVIKNYGLARKDQCVNSIQVMLLLRAVIASRLDTPNLTDEQQQVLKRCLKWLGGKSSSSMAALDHDEGSGIGNDEPELIEQEYRRLLRDCLLRAFAPDYEERAQRLFEEYKLYAPAIFEGKKTVNDKNEGGKTPVEAKLSLVEELDRFRVGKDKFATLTDEDKKFRGQLDAVIGLLRDQHVAEHGPDSVKDFKITWTTVTALAQAIRNKLDSEIGALIGKLISTEVTSDLNEFERKQLERADLALKEMGFCDKTRKPVLEYAKRTKVWSFKLDK